MRAINALPKLESNIQTLKYIKNIVPAELQENEGLWTALAGLFNNPECLPNEWFDYLGCGSYKEVYEVPGTNDWVLKFATAEGDIESEARMPECAEVFGISEIFTPMYLFNLLTPLGCEFINIDESYDYDEEIGEYVLRNGMPHILHYMIFQKKVDVFTDVEDRESPTWEEIRSEEWWAADIEAESVGLTKQLWRSFDAPYWWMIDACKHFGTDFMEKLESFIDEYGVADLHSGNIGYDNGVPVIFDWFSESLI